MSILHVRSFPEDLYQRLQELAKQHNRSLSAQVVELLTRALVEEEANTRQATSLSAIRRRRFTPPAETPTSLELLREDRKR